MKREKRRMSHNKVLVPGATDVVIGSRFLDEDSESDHRVRFEREAFCCLRLEGEHEKDLRLFV